MRSVLVIAMLGACWISPPPVHPEPYVIPPRAKEEPPPPVACAAFNPVDPACATICHREAPDDWRGCTASVAELTSKGYMCSNLHPRTCVSPLQIPIPACPANGCVALDARVIGVRVDGAGLVITIAAGRLQGITTAWRAALVDLKTNTPVPNGDITLTRIDRSISVGTITMPIAQLQTTPHVRFEP